MKYLKKFESISDGRGTVEEWEQFINDVDAYIDSMSYILEDEGYFILKAIDYVSTGVTVYVHHPDVSKIIPWRQEDIIEFKDRVVGEFPGLKVITPIYTRPKINTELNKLLWHYDRTTKRRQHLSREEEFKIGLSTENNFIEIQFYLKWNEFTKSNESKEIRKEKKEKRPKCLGRCDKKIVGKGKDRHIYCAGCDRKLKGL